jgi:hypothetical protein
MTPISIPKAQRIAASVAAAIPGLRALETFAKSATIEAGLAADVRKLDAQKTSLKAEGRVTADQYWDIVSLDQFINHHLDDGFNALRASMTAQRASQSGMP